MNAPNFKMIDSCGDCSHMTEEGQCQKYTDISFEGSERDMYVCDDFNAA